MWNPESASTPAVLILPLQGVLEWGRAERLILGEVFAEGKKEEFPGFTKKCCLGTPFPRSALFLEILCDEPHIFDCSIMLIGYVTKSV